MAKSGSRNGVEKEDKIVADIKGGTDREREKAVELAMAQIERSFGKGAIMKMGDAGAKMAVEVISTGAISLDLALGVGGVPRGRIIEIYGPELSVNLPWPNILSPRPKKWAVWLLILT